MVDHLYTEYQKEKKLGFLLLMLIFIGLIGLEKYLTQDLPYLHQASIMAGESLFFSGFFHFVKFPSLFETNVNLGFNFVMQFLICVRISNFDLCLPLVLIGVGLLRNMVIFRK